MFNPRIVQPPYNSAAIEFFFGRLRHKPVLITLLASALFCPLATGDIKVTLKLTTTAQISLHTRAKIRCCAHYQVLHVRR